MKALLLNTVYGIIAFNENNEPIDVIFNDKSPMDLANIYINLQKGELPATLRDYLLQLKNKQFDIIELEDFKLMSSFAKVSEIKFINSEDILRLKKIRTDIINSFTALHIPFSMDGMMSQTKVMSEFMIKQQVAEISTQHDLHVKQCVDTISDVNKSINLLATRLREWYGLHFPELTDNIIDDNIAFAQIVAKLGTRENFTKAKLISDMNLNEQKAEFIESKSLRSMGGVLTETDIKNVQFLAQQTLDLVVFKDKMESYLSEILQEVAPNIKYLIGVAVASQLIALAGSLEKLAEFPSSTIQLLGAEKALFKALKYHVKTPKHGIIFQWHKIRSEKAYLRGKISRMLAGKISICAKVDFYKGQFIGEKMAKEVDEKIELIKKSFPKPPKESKKSSSSEYQHRDRPQHGDQHKPPHGDQRRPPHGDQHKPQQGEQPRDQFSRKKKEHGKRGGGKPHFKD